MTTELADVEVVAFDGDDTLWHSENYFELTTDRFVALVAPWCSSTDAAADGLIEKERANLATYGYGIKSFTLSMIELALDVSDGTIPGGALQEIIGWGKEMIAHPVDLLPGVMDTIAALEDNYRLMIITKGDLFHQEAKVAESGISEHFDAIHIVSEKNPSTYQRIIDEANVAPDQFLMVGNSVVSDVHPVLECGGHAIHVPYRVTWAHEETADAENRSFLELGRLDDLISLLT